MEAVCLMGTVSIPDGLVSVGEDTFSVPFGLKWCHEMEVGWGLVWNSRFGSMVFHATFCRNNDLFYSNTTPFLYILPFLTTWVAIFGPVRYEQHVQ